MNITIDKAVLEQALEALNHGITEMNHRGCAIECMPLHHATKAIREELAQPQPVQQGPVAYLDIGAGGYLDIATNLTDEQLLSLPKGRHALVIAGTFGIDGYTSPQAQPQPVPHSQFGSPELGAMILARCVEKDQEPVATVIKKGSERQWMSERLGRFPDGIYSLYTSPQAAQPLSDEQITKLPVWRHFVGLMPEHHVEITRAIEQAHGITKGTT